MPDIFIPCYNIRIIPTREIQGLTRDVDYNTSRLRFLLYFEERIIRYKIYGTVPGFPDRIYPRLA